jgi:hypothetical protein
MILAGRLDHQTAILFPKKKQTQIPILVSCKKNQNKTRGLGELYRSPDINKPS